MRRTEVMQEVRRMRFLESYDSWHTGRLTQEEAARLLGVGERTFRRYIGRFIAEGLDGLQDKRLSQVSHRKAPVDEVLQLTTLYSSGHSDWNVRHFHCWYRREQKGSRSYTWVKKALQAAGLVAKGKKKGVHRKRRDRSPMAGMMLHQDGSRHEWVAGNQWDLIATMDDATSEVYSLFFVDEEGTMSSFQGVADVINQMGLFSSLYTDRGSHYWHTPKAGGKVDKSRPTQFGRAMRHLGIEMIAAYSPEARGRSERLFRTLQGRLPQELKYYGITGMEAANKFLNDVFLPSFNKEFRVEPAESGSAFVAYIGGDLSEVLCLQESRTVTNDNCVCHKGLTLQIPANRYRCHYVKVKVRVHEYQDGSLAVFHGPRCLERYNSTGNALSVTIDKAA